jgi:TetR/AcrR family transcriptional regulator, ethionamide resistance regulator
MTTANPLRSTHDDRRGLLSRHFIAVLEPLMEAGEPYPGMSVQRIIEAGGIARSTFYAYFADKGELLSAMAEDVISDLSEAGHSWWALPHDAGRAALRAALTPALEVQRAHRAVLEAVADTAAHDPRVRSRQQALIGQVVGNLARHIADAQAAGSACPDLDPRHTAQWLIWMHERGLHQLVGPAPADEVEPLLAALTGIVWRTLYEGYRAA